MEEEFAFVDTNWKHYTGHAPYKRCTSYGIRRLHEDKGIKLTQIMVDPILLKMYKIAGKRLPKARFVGRAPPVVYATFNECVDPFLKHGYMHWNATRKDAYTCLMAQFKEHILKHNTAIGWKEF